MLKNTAAAEVCIDVPLAAQVEGLLKKYKSGEEETGSSNAHMHIEGAGLLDDFNLQLPLDMNQPTMSPGADGTFADLFDPSSSSFCPQINPAEHLAAPLDDESLWAMIELGVEEPLPPQDAIDEL